MKDKIKRFTPSKRSTWLVGGSIVVLLLNYMLDPTGHWSKIAVYLQELTMPIIVVWFAYLARKALSPYIDVSELVDKAKESTVGSGLVVLASAIITFALLGLFNSARAQDVKTYIPTQAYTHVYQLKDIAKEEWPDHPKLVYSQP